MPNTHFRPKRPKRFGAAPAFLASTAVSSTANTTVTIQVPTPRRKFFLDRVTVRLSTLGVDADGTILVRVRRRNNAGAGSDVNLSDGLFSLKVDGVPTADVPVRIPLNGTDEQRTFNEGDTLNIQVISNSAAIDTAPVGHFIPEVLVLE